ncbi:RNA polymerase sigma factor [Fulvivirga ligni]|uniref:RNA polymerase sigma factor n=1 Tax=Fulvivirga ligni TaxID=2904246 RepID=UPI001F3F8CAD|nr:RNA polymerase sigma factor [Fulvivirga ligni]UII21291.1 RNA polymerase sigma factor [Fulvivirga ligni]
MLLKEKFQAYFNSYQEMVFSLCLGYSKGDRDLANDLTQETFVKVWAALPKFRSESAPKTWIYRICVNTCLLHIRKERNASKTEVSDVPSVTDDSTHEDYSHLYSAIGQLKELDRVIILLVLDELEYAEIATIVGISEGNLRVKISRIKKKLNQLLSNHG